jgi:hypothetical protein
MKYEDLKNQPATQLLYDLFSTLSEELANSLPSAKITCALAIRIYEGDTIDLERIHTLLHAQYADVEELREAIGDEYWDKT